MSGTGYDLSTSIYSQDGRIFQVEYANKAIEAEETFIGLKTSQGVVLACEKIQRSPLESPESNRRIFALEGTINIGINGRLPDGRLIIARAKKECKGYRKNFGRTIPISVLVERIANYVHYHTIYAQLRPLGCNIFVSGFEEDRYHLFMVENTGIFRSYLGVSSGKGRQIARNKLEKFNQQETIDNGIKTCALAIAAAHEEFKEKNYELEMAVISSVNQNRHKLLSLEETNILRTAAEEILDQ